jgi:hypothetical protein
MMFSTKPGLWLALFLLSVSTACCRAQDFPAPMQGPADLRNQRPYQLLFLAFSPESATVLDAGRAEGSLQLDIANDLLIPKQNNTIVVHEDTETQRLALKERRGLGHGFEATLAIPIIARDAGVTDKLIANYHVLINDTHTTPDNAAGRNHMTPYHSDVYFTDPTGKKVIDLHPTAGVGDIQATIKRALWGNGHTAGAIRAGVKLPTGNASDAIGSGGVDEGVDFDTQAALGNRLAVFGNVSYVWLSKAHGALKPYTRRFIRHGTIAVEYYTSDHSSWLLQNDIGDAGIHTGNYFADDNQALISLAYKFSPRPDTLYTYAFTENGGVVADKWRSIAQVGPDPTFSFGWSRFY